MINLLKFIKGYVTVIVHGENAEKFLNMCVDRNILLWDIRMLSEKTYTVCMSIKAYKKTRHFAIATATSLKLSKKQGVPFLIYRLKFRKGIIVGLVLSLVLFLSLTSFVWRIDVVGNERVTKEEILNALNKAGFKKGTLRYGIDEAMLQNKVLLDLKELSWMWVYVKGTRAVVDVRERVDPPEMIQSDTTSNIVAERDGLITEIVVRNGNANVKVGDTVKKGELVISGVVPIGEDGYRLVNAQGDVIARTWYEKGEFFPFEVKKYKKTGEKISKKVVKLPGFDVLLYIDKNIPYKDYETKVTEHTFDLMGIDGLKVGYVETVYEKLEEYNATLTCDDILPYAEDKIKALVEDELGEDVSIVDISAEHTLQDDGVYIKIIYECIEQIGEKIYLG